MKFLVFRSHHRIFEADTSKVLSLGKIQTSLFFHSLIRTFVKPKQKSEKVMSKQKKKQKKSVTKGTRRGLTKRDVYDLVRQFLSERPNEYFSLRELFKLLKFTTHPLKMLCVDVLNDMLRSDDIVQNEEGEVSYNGHAQTCEGTFTRTQGGRNYVELPDGGNVSIYDADTLHAMPGDRVRVSLFAQRRGSTKLHGEVVEILERSTRPII